jgi:hypothetical protein
MDADENMIVKTVAGWPALSVRRSKDISSVVINVHPHLSCEKAFYNNDVHRTPNALRSFIARQVNIGPYCPLFYMFSPACSPVVCESFYR